MIVQFYTGVDKARQIFNEHGENALEEHMQDMGDPDVKVKEIISYIEKFLWNQYDEMSSDSIDIYATKKMIEDITKRDDTLPTKSKKKSSGNCLYPTGWNTDLSWHMMFIE